MWNKEEDRVRRYMRAADVLDPKEDIILDVGCGSGEMAQYLPKGCWVIGLDVDASAKKNRLMATKGTATSLPFKSNTFDSMLMLEVIEHMEKEDALEALKEAKRTLKRGGVLLITTPNKWHILLRIFLWVKNKLKGVGSVEVLPYYEHVHEFNIYSLRKIISEVGFNSTVWMSLPYNINQQKGVRRKLIEFLFSRFFGHLWAVATKEE